MISDYIIPGDKIELTVKSSIDRPNKDGIIARKVYRTRIYDIVSEDEIKCAVQQVYRGFLQPEALIRRLFSTRTLFDLGFYYRGIRSLVGHLVDFRRHQ